MLNVLSPKEYVVECRAARDLAGQNLVQGSAFDPKISVNFLRDFFLGFFVSGALILVAPKIVKGYWRWLTRAPNSN